MKQQLLVLALLTLTSCVTLTGNRSAREHLTVHDAPDLAFAKATRAAMAMGGHMTMTDPVSRSLSARLNKAVILNVTVTQDGQGTIVGVQATAETGYVLLHDVPDDVHAFIAAYRRE